MRSVRSHDPDTTRVPSLFEALLRQGVIVRPLAGLRYDAARVGARGAGVAAVAAVVGRAVVDVDARHGGTLVGQQPGGGAAHP